MNRKYAMAVIAMAMAVLMIGVVSIPQSDSEPQYGAMVGDIGYDTLQEAVATAESGSTVVLTSDADITSGGLNVGKEITLDLNGHDILASGKDGKRIFVTTSGKLTLIDSKDQSNNGSAGKIYGTDPYNYSAGVSTSIVEVYGEFVMNSGCISYALDDPVNKGMFGVGVSKQGKVIVNGGKIEVGWYAISGNGSDTSQNTQVTINGGYLTSTSDYCIYNPQTGNVTINGGYIYGAAGAVCMNRGNVVINGGFLTSKGIGNTGVWGDGTGGLSNAALYLWARYSDVTATINGGKLTSEGDAVLFGETSVHSKTLRINGGAFSSEPSSTYIAEGLEATLVNGLYYVAATVTPSDSTPSFVETEETNIVVDMGSSETATVKMPSVKVSITAGNSLGGIAVSAEHRTFVQAPGATGYEITIACTSNYYADITVNAIIPTGHQALAYYINEYGELVPVQVIDYTSTTVTFRTTHTTPFVIMSEEIVDVPTTPGEEEEEYPFFPGHGSNQGSTMTTTKDSSDDTTKVIAAAAAVVVIMLAAVALMVNRNN